MQGSNILPCKFVDGGISISLIKGISRFLSPEFEITAECLYTSSSPNHVNDEENKCNPEKSVL